MLETYCLGSRVTALEPGSRLTVDISRHWAGYRVGSSNEGSSQGKAGSLIRRCDSREKTSSSARRRAEERECD